MSAMHNTMQSRVMSKKQARTRKRVGVFTQ